MQDYNVIKAPNVNIDVHLINCIDAGSRLSQKAVFFFFLRRDMLTF